MSMFNPNSLPGQSNNITEIQEVPQSASEFILTVLKLQIPICKQDDLVTASGHPLGSGASMVVRRGSWKGKVVAIKTLNLRVPDGFDGSHDVRIIREEHADRFESLTKEVRFLSYHLLRKHPNIVPLLGISWTVEEELDGRSTLLPVAIVELQDYTLAQFIDQSGETLSITLKAVLISDIISGLAALHKAGLVHSDIKPENIMISEAHRPIAKIVDFGYSIQKFYGDLEKGSTRAWMSPENHLELLQKQSKSNTGGQQGGRDQNEERDIASYASLLTDDNKVEHTKQGKHQARDIFSLGLVAIFILKGVSPLGHAFGEDDRKWLLLKLKSEADMLSWLRSKFRVLDEGSGTQHQDDSRSEASSSSISTADTTWQMRQNTSDNPEWMNVPTSVPMKAIACIPGLMLARDPKHRLSSMQLQELFSTDTLESNLWPQRYHLPDGDNRNTTLPLMDNWQLQDQVPISDIPREMWEPLWNELLEAAKRTNAPASLMTFIGMCYLDGDGVDEDVDEGLSWLLKAATEGVSDGFHSAQARQNVLIEYGRIFRKTQLSFEDEKKWILDSIFFLSGGYWYHLGHSSHISKLEAARASFANVLTHIRDDEAKRILEIGLNIYVMQNPTGRDDRNIREENAKVIDYEILNSPYLDTERSVWKAVFRADDRLATNLLECGVDFEMFWDVRLVRAVAHYGYEDSIRILHRLDVLKQAIDEESSLETAHGALIKSIDDTSLLTKDFSGEPSIFMPAVHEAVVHHRFSCLTEMLSQTWRASGADEQIMLDNTYTVDERYGSETPLEVAVRMLQPYLVCVLLAYGANPNHPNSNTGDTPLHACCRMDVEFDDDEVCWSKLSYLLRVSDEYKTEDMIIAHRVILELLLEHSEVDVNSKNLAGETPLQLCAELENLGFLMRLVECGAECVDELHEILGALSLGTNGQ